MQRARSAVGSAVAGRFGARPLARPALSWRPPVATWVALEIERRTPFPWIAVAFRLGILLFFQADGRPALWAPLAGLAVGAALALRQRLLLFATTVTSVAVFAGFTAGLLRLDAVRAPVLDKLVIGKLEGFVESVEERRYGARLVVLVQGIAGVDPERRPTRVRVTLRTLGALKPGNSSRERPGSCRPPEAAWPGGYDFAREAYFRGIGAVGSLVGAVEIKAPPAAPPWRLTVAAGVDDTRKG